MEPELAGEFDASAVTMRVFSSVLFCFLFCSAFSVQPSAVHVV
jgi:hypothetical protein